MFAGEIWNTSEKQAREEVEFCKQSLMGYSGQSSEQNAERNVNIRSPDSEGFSWEQERHWPRMLHSGRKCVLILPISLDFAGA